MRVGGVDMVPLYLKTEYSLLESMIRIPDLISYAKEHHIDTLAITDSNLYGAMEFYLACKKNDIKPIIGLEIKLNDLPFVVYAKSYCGYQSLLKLSTIQSERSLSIEEVEMYSVDLLCIVPFESSPLYHQLNKIYQDLFIGYESKDQRMQLKKDNAVYMKPIYYLTQEDEKFYPYLIAIQKGILLEDVTDKKEGHRLFPEMKYDISFEMDLHNHEKIELLCQFELEKEENLLPIYDCPNGLDAYSYLKQLCIEGLRRIFGTTVKKVYLERLKYELDTIQKMGFCNYFLVVWDYVKYAKDHGILVGPGRGSAAGSLVSYCLNITDVDPIQYDLLFERFLNPERITMPDIDIDFEYNRREEVIQYCIQKYGFKRVAGIITFGTLGAKQVIRDVARTMDIDLKLVDRVCKLLDARMTLLENYKASKKLIDLIQYDRNLQKLYQVALRLEGLKRHTSIHAAGIVMCQKDLDEVIPLSLSHEGFYTTGYSMEYLEDLGLLKMDFLALRNLTLIRDVLDSVEKIEHTPLSFTEIPLDDKEAISIFTEVNTVGIFQFESSGMMNFLRKFRPNSFEEVAAAIALFRPGPMQNIDHFIKRKRGLEKIEYIHPDLEPILKSTYGIIVYQEQIMQIARLLAGYTYGEADVLRRAMSKKKEEVLIREKDKFIKQSIARGYTEEVATEVYDLILKFASYGFNRAHSVAYSMIAYKMAYLKAHYTQHFMKSLLSMVIGSEVKTKEYSYECKLNHITLLPPDINLSGKEYQIEKSGIRYPFSSIKNIGGSVVSILLEERNKRPFTDIYDFFQRCYGKAVNKKAIESLNDAGCFRSFGINQHTLYENIDLLINYSEVAHDIEEEYVEKPMLQKVEEYSKKERMQKELEVFGFYLSEHPVTEKRLRYPNSITIAMVPNYFDREIDIVLYVDKVKEISTKKNDKMGFITGSDELNTIDVVLFPKIYEQYSLEKGDIILVRAKVEKRFDKLQLVVRQLQKLEEDV